MPRAIGNGTIQSLSQILTPIGGITKIPVATQVAAQITAAQAHRDTLTGDAGEGRGGVDSNLPDELFPEPDEILTTLRGDFKFVDATPNDPTRVEDFYGAIYIVGVGAGIADGSESGWSNSTTMHIQIWKNYTELLANVWVTGGGDGGFEREGGIGDPGSTSWTLVEDKIYDTPITLTGDGINAYLNFITPISDGDVITFTTQVEEDVVRPKHGVGIASEQNSYARHGQDNQFSAQANFGEAINAYGFAFAHDESVSFPIPGLPWIGGPGPWWLLPPAPLPGDLNGDNVIDGEDLEIWEEILRSSGDDQSTLAVISPDGEHTVHFVTQEGDVTDLDSTFGNLTLREAINAAEDGDTILIAPWIDEVQLENGHLGVDEDITIIGNGMDATTIIADSGSRVFDIHSGVYAEIRGVTIIGGNLPGYGGGILANGDVHLSGVRIADNSSSAGGGIAAFADLTIKDSVIVGNNSSNVGGGIFVSSTAHLILSNSTVDNNDAVHGGGIFVDPGFANAIDIENSTISNNSASGGGGGLFVQSFAGSAAGGAIANSTISGNSAASSGGLRVRYSTANLNLLNVTIASNTGNGAGGLDIVNSAVVTAHNSIIADNKNNSAADSDVNGSLQTGPGGSSYNLIGRGGAGGLTDNDANHNLVLASTELSYLAPLGDYGGGTKTHALMLGSQALDNGNDSLVGDFDQRGFERNFPLPIGGSSDYDIGAYEAGDETQLTVRIDDDRLASMYTADELSLREALAISASLAGSEIIIFDPALYAENSATIELSYDSTTDMDALPDALAITSDVIIEGPVAELLIIESDGQSRAIVNTASNVSIRRVSLTGGYLYGALSSSGGDLTLEGVTITGNASQVAGAAGVTFGGGLLSLLNSTIDGNNSFDSGGVYVENGDLLIHGTTISNNFGSAGGGLRFVGSGDLTIVNSTISGNSGWDAGGLNVSVSGTLQIVNATITDNQSYTGMLYSGGLLLSGSSTTLTMHNTILAGNQKGSADHDLLVTSGATINSGSSNNLIGYDPNDYFPDGNGNLIGESSPWDPELAPLGNYGGFTKTHRLLSTSDAIDAGDNDKIAALDLEFDQRGLDRVVNWEGGDIVDIGAIELAIGEIFS